MTSPYESFTYITPPRTEAKRSPESLSGLENKGFLSQIKKNGTNSVIFVDPDRNVIGYNRHGEQHRAWQFDDKTSEIFRNIPGRKWFVLNGELIHSKTKHIKNIHYLYDILVCDGIHLTGTTYEERYDLLHAVLAKRILGHHGNDHFRLDDYTQIARNYTSGFRKLFDSLTAPEDEGLVLRNPLARYYTSKADTWMVKVRRPEITKLY